MEEWATYVRTQDIGARALGEIAKEGSFSGSKIGLRSLLQLRAVWPAKKSIGTARLGFLAAGLFAPEDLAFAEEIGVRMQRSHEHPLAPGFLQSLEKAKSFLDVLDAYHGAGRNTPPPLGSISGGDNFGTFATSLLNFYNLRSTARVGNDDDASEYDYSPKTFAYGSSRDTTGATDPLPKINYRRLAKDAEEMASFIQDTDDMDISPAQSEDSPPIQAQKAKPHANFERLAEKIRGRQPLRLEIRWSWTQRPQAQRPHDLFPGHGTQMKIEQSMKSKLLTFPFPL